MWKSYTDAHKCSHATASGITDARIYALSNSNPHGFSRFNTFDDINSLIHEHIQPFTYSKPHSDAHAYSFAESVIHSKR